jgi:hypothetical protein
MLFNSPSSGSRRGGKKEEAGKDEGGREGGGVTARGAGEKKFRRATGAGEGGREGGGARKESMELPRPRKRRVEMRTSRRQ